MCCNAKGASILAFRGISKLDHVFNSKSTMKQRPHLYEGVTCHGQFGSDIAFVHPIPIVEKYGISWVSADQSDTASSRGASGK